MLGLYQKWNILYSFKIIAFFPKKKTLLCIGLLDGKVELVSGKTGYQWLFHWKRINMLNTPTNAVAHSLHHLFCSLFLKEYKNDCVFLLIIVKYSEFQKIQHIILLFVTQGLFVVSLGVLQFCIFSLCHY